jgi:hypothetical protein
MDTSFWIRCNPKISVEHSSKKYYGQYFYKLVLYAPAGRLILQKNSIKEDLEHRINVVKNINFGGYWGGRSWVKNPDEADVVFLETLKNIKHMRLGDLKFRIEEPYIQVYGKNLDSLEALVSNHIPSKYYEFVQNISGPKDEKSKEILNSGAIIRKKDCGYRYKIICRDGNYGAEVKHHILNYLEKLDADSLLMTPGCRKTLENNSNYIWNLYLYVNDASIISFLNLICPGLVSNYHELVVLPDK